jgi:aerobic-type carbon monoxide dehydrogenase small subunit (CoxS/CutS family)
MDEPAGAPGTPTMTLTMTVNRRPVSVEIDPSEPLAYTLRNRLGLTGTKVSCDVQACGACAVLVDGLPRSACTFLAYEARGRDVLTVEGLAPDEERLHPLQQAFLDANAFQCGFCTSGMLVAAHAFLTTEADTGDEELIEYMSGNLCRCTGYLPIVAAILKARLAQASQRPAPPASGRG